MWTFVRELRPAFSRTRPFLWFALALAGLSVRGDLRGVTSLVRALGLRQNCYDRLLDFFHSRGVDMSRLSRGWAALVLATLRPLLLAVNGRIVLLANGIKAPKTGRKMPGVKKLHQQSQNNTKPETIFGHSCQAIAVVVQTASSFFALPLACRIHEGTVFSNRDRRTLLDKLVELLVSLGIALPAYLVAVAYYAAAKIICPLLQTGQHLIAAAKMNAVADEPTESPSFPGRGRPRRSGDQYLHRESDDYRARVRCKLAAYHCHIQLGIIAQGFLQCLAVLDPHTVWRQFGSWLHTVRPGILPSEQVVAVALRHSLPEFLADSPPPTSSRNSSAPALTSTGPKDCA